MFEDCGLRAVRDWRPQPGRAVVRDPGRAEVQAASVWLDAREGLRRVLGGQSVCEWKAGEILGREACVLLEAPWKG